MGRHTFHESYLLQAAQLRAKSEGYMRDVREGRRDGTLSRDEVASLRREADKLWNEADALAMRAVQIVLTECEVRRAQTVGQTHPDSLMRLASLRRGADNPLVPGRRPGNERGRIGAGGMRCAARLPACMPGVPSLAPAGRAGWLCESTTRVLLASFLRERLCLPVL